MSLTFELTAFHPPHHNVGVVGKRGIGRHCLLDVDAPGVVERIENETRHEMPKGYRVNSSPTSKPYKTHFYFKRTPYSFEITKVTILEGGLETTVGLLPKKPFDILKVTTTGFP
jgi:hypothetical protein